MAADVARIVPTASDADRAKAYREEVASLLAPVVAAVERARLDGLQIAFNVGPDDFGRMSLKTINISKPL